MTNYIAYNGIEITDEMIERWEKDIKDEFTHCEMHKFEGHPTKVSFEDLPPEFFEDLSDAHPSKQQAS
ncbi:hypothetical protein R6G85_05855 [Actinotignum urinale]|uniref:hypothetical protein n=1 Tax=Actinotignum urinale TaxID=190146 RepID=UPI002A82DD1A|nr:hypothetical protein [Actinotignum urinale]MDY5152000.1 hypothetical protein [Actinotignum urinale]